MAISSSCRAYLYIYFCFFLFFDDPATTEIYTLSLHDALPICDAAKIRAMVVRKTKTDRRDALHLLELLRHDRLPTIWVPDPATRDRRALLAHRMRLVRIRTTVKNGLHAIALSHRLVEGSKRLTKPRLAVL